MATRDSIQREAMSKAMHDAGYSEKDIKEALSKQDLALWEAAKFMLPGSTVSEYKKASKKGAGEVARLAGKDLLWVVGGLGAGYLGGKAIKAGRKAWKAGKVRKAAAEAALKRSRTNVRTGPSGADKKKEWDSLNDKLNKAQAELDKVMQESNKVIERANQLQGRAKKNMLKSAEGTVKSAKSKVKGLERILERHAHLKPPVGPVALPEPSVRPPPSSSRLPHEYQKGKGYEIEVIIPPGRSGGPKGEK